MSITTEIQKSKVFTDSNGNVGIGTNNPEFPLHIIDSKFTEYGTGGWVTGYNGTGSSGYGSAWYGSWTNGTTALKIDEGSIWLSGVPSYLLVSSDNRIKCDISLINDNTALDIVNELESYEYNYIDPLRKKPKKTIGFLAQEVYRVLPNAVSLQKNYIPDEMRIIKNSKWTNIDNGKYKLTIDDIDLSGNHTGMLKFYVTDDISGNHEICKEIMIDDDKKSFIFEKKWEKVFLYGKEVNDFHTIDKAQIFALHHSAIQELSRLNDTKTQEITELKEKLLQLETENTQLKADMALVKQKLGI